MRKYYKYYFERLAIHCKAIAHDPDAEADKAFVFIKDIYNPDAFDAAVTKAGKTPAMLLENYRTKLSGGKDRNYFRYLYGRFDILSGTLAGDQDTIDAAQELCEEIAEELLAKMREDLMEGDYIVIAVGDTSKKIFFPFEDIEIDPIGPIASKYYGVSVSFYWRTPAQGKSNPANWS